MLLCHNYLVNAVFRKHFSPALLKNVCVKAFQVCVEFNRVGIGALPVKLLKQIVHGLEDAEYSVELDFV